MQTTTREMLQTTISPPAEPDARFTRVGCADGSGGGLSFRQKRELTARLCERAEQMLQAGKSPETVAFALSVGNAGISDAEAAELAEQAVSAAQEVATRTQAARRFHEAEELRAKGRTLKEIRSEIIADGAGEPVADVVEQHVREVEAEAKERRRRATSRENGEQGGRKPLPHAEMAQGFIDATATRFTLRWWRGEWWQYRAGHGWRELPDAELDAEIMTFLKLSERYREHAKRYTVREIVAHLEAFTVCGLSSDISMPSWLSRDASGRFTGESAENFISFAGQIFDVVSMADYIGGLLPEPPPVTAVDETFFSADQCPYAYDPDAQCPMFKRFLAEIVDPPERDQLQRMFGLMLSGLTRYEVFFYLYGPSARNGKNTLLTILGRLLNGSVSHVDLGKLADRFAAWPLAHVRVNVTNDFNANEYGDLSHIEGVFKDLVSGASFEYEKKNEQKRTERCRARFIFASNGLPKFTDKSDALWQRMRIILFPRQIPTEQRDPDLADRIIKSELPGILNWALLGLADVRQARLVPETPSGESIKNDLRRSCDNEAQFFGDAGLEAGEGRLPAAGLYGEYRAWMIGNGLKPLGSANFVRRLTSVFPSVEIKPLWLDGQTQRCIDGLKHA